MRAKRASAIIIMLLLLIVSIWGMISFVLSEINFKTTCRLMMTTLE